VFSGKEVCCHILYSQRLIVQAVFYLIDLASFYSSTIHRTEAFLAGFVDDFDWYQDADLVGRYGVQDQRKRVADKAFHERIAGRVGG
jgi:hypothetical protein